MIKCFERAANNILETTVGEYDYTVLKELRHDYDPDNLEDQNSTGLDYGRDESERLVEIDKEIEGKYIILHIEYFFFIFKLHFYEIFMIFLISKLHKIR